MMHLIRALLTLALSGRSMADDSCRCRPSDPCWPSHTEWDKLNNTSNGQLVALKPIGNVCHGSAYNKAACDAVSVSHSDSIWRSDHPAASQWPNWEQWPENNEFCSIITNNETCSQGRVSLYSLQATAPKHIQAGVRFAGDHNLRLAVRNTGHDFAGKSNAIHSLQINMHSMKSMKAHANFVPAGGESSGKAAGEGLAVTLGAGVQLNEMYNFLADQGLIVVGGTSHGVGAAGGYIQGGGHSVIAPVFGMASDNALEFQIVVADGRLVTANAHQNSDLFWALRGGGGGTWGIVTSVTVRAFEDHGMVTYDLDGGGAYQSDEYWNAVEYLHAVLPEYTDAGGGMYYYLLPDLQDDTAGHISAMHIVGAFGNTTDLDSVNQIMLPIVEKLGNITGAAFTYTPAVHEKITDWYVDVTAPSDAAGTPYIIGSRLITKELLSSDDGPHDISVAIRSLRTVSGNTQLGEYALQGNVVAGPAVSTNGDKVDSALHPVWRKALLHLMLGRGWAPNASIEEQQEVQRNLTKVEVPILKDLDDDSDGGAYLNEADPYEEDFQDSFWGHNYDRLYEIKQKWDPDNLFIVRTGVGSEDWDAEGFCRV